MQTLFGYWGRNKIDFQLLRSYFSVPFFHQKFLVMKDVSSLKKKLAGYSAMAAAVMAANHNADAQVIYHDIVPDSILQYNTSADYFDLNNDGVSDFVFVAYSYQSGTCVRTTFQKVKGLNGANIRSNWTFASGAYLLFSCGLALEELISENQNDWWFEARMFDDFCFYGYYTDSCTCIEENGMHNENYLGIRFTDSVGVHYGWIRVQSVSSHLTIYDYAYDSIPGQSIWAGQIYPTLIDGVITSNLFNTFIENHHLILHFPQSPLPSGIILFNDVGVKLNEQAITQSQLIIDVSNLAAGVYFVAVDDGEKRQVKKVVIE